MLRNGLVDMFIIPDHTGVPGTVIDYSPASLGRYIGSPSIAIAANGDYFASHDFFGPGTDNNEMAVFKSEDSGETWEKISTIFGQWWSTIFFHEEELYLRCRLLQPIGEVSYQDRLKIKSQTTP